MTLFLHLGKEDYRVTVDVNTARTPSLTISEGRNNTHMFVLDLPTATSLLEATQEIVDYYVSKETASDA